MHEMFGVGEGYNKPSESIKKILSEKSKTLEDLLRDEDLLNELDSKNEKLIKYFSKEKIKLMLDYIIKEPEIDENDEKTQENKDKGYKFPYLCSQIFGLQLDELYKYFFMTNKQVEEESNKEKNINNNISEKEKNKKKEDKNEEKGNEKSCDKENSNDHKKENKADENENKKDENNKEGKKEEENKETVLNKVEEGEEKIKDDKDKEERNEKDKKREINGDIKEDNNKEKERNIGEIKEENKNEKNQENESLENRIELIDYLFTFFPKESEGGKNLNYVLCGYFSSMITNLLDMNPSVFLKYIYIERKDIFNLMTSHCYRKSISQALSKILHYENYLNEHSIQLEEEIKKDMNETRIQVLVDIFTSISIDMDNEQLNSIYYFIIDLFEPTSILEVKDLFKTMIENEKFLKGLIHKPLYNLDLTTNLDENTQKKRQNLMSIIDIIIFILMNIKKLKLEIPTCSLVDSLSIIKHTKISQEIFDFLPNLIKVNFNKRNNIEKKILQSFNEYKLSPLGEYKTKIVSLIYHLIPYFKKIPNYFDEILIESEFFKYGFDFIFEYEWNNLYQESFLSLLKSLLDSSASHELLSDYLFNKLNLFEIIKKHSNTEDKFQFENKDISNNISHGYSSFLISLSYKLNTAIGGTSLGVNTNPSTEGSFEFLPKGNDDIDKIDTINLLNNVEDEIGKDKKENKEEEEIDEVKKGVPIECMKKYLNDDWKLFFNDNISDLIKQYCNKNWPSREKEMDIFDFLFQDNNDSDNQNENKEENKDINNENNNINIDENKEVKVENEEIDEKNKLMENKEKEQEENKKEEKNDDIKKNKDNKKEMIKEDENKKKEEVKEEIKVEENNKNEKK